MSANLRTKSVLTPIVATLAALLFVVVVPTPAHSSFPPTVMSPAYAWSQLNATGPYNRSEATLVYATPSNAAPYALLFGGRTGPTKVFDDTWIFQNGTWREVHPPVHPGPTRFGMAVWDGADNEVVFFGGSNKTAYSNETWVYRLGHGWTELFPVVAPPARRSGGMAYDAAGGYVVLWGGHDGTSVTNQADYRTYNDTWTFRAGVWTDLNLSVGPVGVSEPTMVYDAAAQAIVEFGGYTQNGEHGYHALNATWAFANGGWTNLSLPVAPSPRDGAAAAYDPAFGGILLVGGQDEGVHGQCLLNDSWALVGATLGTLTWVPGGTTPLLPMDSASMVYDTAMGAVILFGGTGTNGRSVCLGSMEWYRGTWEFA